MTRWDEFFAGERATKILLWAVLGVVLAMFGYAVFFVPSIRADTEASRRTDDIASCRGVYRSGVDEANARLYEAFGTIQLITATASVNRQDIFVMDEAREALGPAIEEQVASRGALRDANKAYSDANNLSRTNPEQFLAQCQEDR